MRKNSLNDLIEMAKASSVEVLSKKYLGASFRYEFKCLKCSKIFQRLYYNFYSNKNCPFCKKEDHRQYNKKNVEYWRSFALSNNMLFTDEKYVSARYSHSWKCLKCEHAFNNAPCNIKRGSRCPRCVSKEGYHEKLVRDIFEDTLGKKFVKVRPDFLKNPKTNRNLELDGYCEELKLAFEYDGEFHYKDLKSNDIVKTKERDALKDKLCKENGVKLIRVPYTEKHRLEDYISSQIETELHEIH